MSVSSLLKAKATEPKKKKSDVPEVAASALHDTIAEKYIAMRDAEEAFRAAEAELVQRAAALYANNAKSGSFSKSYNFPGLRSPGMQISYKDQFAAIPSENEAPLKELLGDKYDHYFEEKRELTLTDTSDANVSMLIEKLGQELFLQLFKIKLNITAKSDMDRRQFDLPEAVRVYLKQYKPSVKLIK